jgi:GTP-binding protein Era
VDRSGFVAIVGRPNVGKSTLLNALIGEKVSIVTAKPHTTRHRILGVLNRGTAQAVFIDTPGHEMRSKQALHRLMARAIHQAIEDCDVILFVIEAPRCKPEDRRLIEMLAEHAHRTILVINKVDRVPDKTGLFPLLQDLQAHSFLAYVPISAKKGSNLDQLADEIIKHLPVGPAIFPAEMSTDKDARFRAAELIREQLFINLHEEIPYGLTVEVEHMGREESGRWRVHGLIWLDKESHKPIVIGKQGEALKRVGSAARQELVELLGGRVHLELWVKIREHWYDNERELQRLGFDGS